MFFFNRNARALEHAQIQWLGLAYKASNQPLTQAFQSRLNSKQPCTIDGDILTTKIGFSSVAIHTDHATAFQGYIVAPGVDHNGKQGFLVIDDQSAPIFSLSSTAGEALAEALQSQTQQKPGFSHA